MDLILKETIASLGREGEVVKVKDGYGRNYLLPQGKAVPATPANLANLEKNRAVIAARLAKEQQQAENPPRALAVGARCGGLCRFGLGRCQVSVRLSIQK